MSSLGTLDKVEGILRRYERAQELVMRGKVIEAQPNVFNVGSQTDPAQFYVVDRNGCNCPDAQKDEFKGICKHRLAAMLLLKFRAVNEEQAARADEDNNANNGASGPADFCKLHNITMKEYTKGTQHWYSHKANDAWCKGQMAA